MDSSSGNLTSAIFDGAGNAVTGFTGVLKDGVSGVSSLFWNGTNLTMLGTLLVVGIGISVVMFGFKLIKSLLHR